MRRRSEEDVHAEIASGDTASKQRRIKGAQLVKSSATLRAVAAMLIVRARQAVSDSRAIIEVRERPN